MSWEADQGAASETGEERTSEETKWERWDILFKGGIYDICKGKKKKEYADLRRAEEMVVVENQGDIDERAN